MRAVRGPRAGIHLREKNKNFTRNSQAQQQHTARPSHTSTRRYMDTTGDHYSAAACIDVYLLCVPVREYSVELCVTDSEF